MNIETIVEIQRVYFQTGVTKSVEFRLNALKKLKAAIQNNESKINQALKKDLNKSNFESYMTEVGMTLGELSYAIKRLGSWVKTKKGCHSFRAFSRQKLCYARALWRYTHHVTLELSIYALY